MAQNILVIGSGAREHAIIRSLHKSNGDNKVFCIATNLNPGIANLCTEVAIKDINNPVSTLEHAKEKKISLAFIGPENPLHSGVSDMLWDNHIKVVGPKKKLAQIETSKTFARNLLSEYGIPGSPKYQNFKSLNGVQSFIEQLSNNYVVKYDGLAGGKGVKVSGEHVHSTEQALEYCQEIINNNGSFLIEEKFIGEEFSLMSFCDGNTLKHMPVVQDHKRAYENDSGPNTGGMGTYTDSNHSLPFLKNEDVSMAKAINEKTAKALKDKFSEGYKGVLYGGFIATKNGVKLIEYNARFGDPEAMNVLSILETDFVDLCNAIVEENLHNVDVKFKKLATVCKYAVPEGYPDNPIKGEKIDIRSVKNKNTLFYGSVSIKGGDLIEEGSRTVAAVGKASSISDAEKIAENEISKIKGPLFHRKDIGTSELIKKRIRVMDLLR